MRTTGAPCSAFRQWKMALIGVQDLLYLVTWEWRMQCRWRTCRRMLSLAWWMPCCMLVSAVHLHYILMTSSSFWKQNLPNDYMFMWYFAGDMGYDMDSVSIIWYIELVNYLFCCKLHIHITSVTSCCYIAGQCTSRRQVYEHDSGHCNCDTVHDLSWQPWKCLVSIYIYMFDNNLMVITRVQSNTLCSYIYFCLLVAISRTTSIASPCPRAVVMDVVCSTGIL